MKDHLDLTLGKTFFDVDNLKKITMEALTEAVQRSVAGKCHSFISYTLLLTVSFFQSRAVSG